MNTQLIPAICRSALTLMVGAAAGHWMGVRALTASATHSSETPVAAPLVPQAAPESIAANPPRPPQEPTTAPASDEDQQNRIEKLLTLLESSMEQNKELRDRIGETNRDLMELRFQVDSYDGQFRPLQVEEEPSDYDRSGSGVLPPRETP